MSSSLQVNSTRSTLPRVPSGLLNGIPAPLVAATSQNEGVLTDAVLELADGTVFRGISFGASNKSVAGECVFQTGES